MEENLRNIHLFRELDDQVLQELGVFTREIDYDRKQYIFIEGQTRDTVYFLHTGTVRVFHVSSDGRETIHQIVRSGQIFPQTGAFDLSVYPGTAETITPCTILSTPRKKFEAWYIKNVSLLKDANKTMRAKFPHRGGARRPELPFYDSIERIVANSRSTS
ncbi:Crp/Fnr family transcriptional regulator [Sulfoacidibacillus thermotolerans]|nr:cyclic nucleotide-binding domain-containing protein [Sulfoacidibacillus thermotolerans]